MKRQLLTLTEIVTVVTIASAALAGNMQNWQGTGAAYSPDGQELSTYQIQVVNTEMGPNVVQSETTVSWPDGSQKVISQKITASGGKWSTDSNLGHGGGACYGDICENYIAGYSGRAFATTIVLDGPNARRNLTVELENGKAVKVLRDQLTRMP